MSLSLTATARPFALLLATVLFIALSGCQTPFVKQEASQPTENRDPACVDRCNLAKNQCEQRQRLRETQCQQDFQQISADHLACVATRGRPCQQPVTCLGADLRICKTQHEECVLACGVRVQSPAEPAPRTDGPLPRPVPDPASEPAQAAVSANPDRV
ncbi:hypothetical protein [Thiocystis violascens]|uniref:Uncharacterized protein n=1 Tax=Thiocystis violascens (strain ATCC 17096 / DSM 198 / 6111) TaxID=765911 RepID=I3Y802_THIV6|nr:hypothetical protein [Thiocystis violascens]AFL73120.1 hypothetical protein Thivi_1089 [Thiocystis violascens DSM 198]